MAIMILVDLLLVVLTIPPLVRLDAHVLQNRQNQVSIQKIPRILSDTAPWKHFHACSREDSALNNQVGKLIPCGTNVPLRQVTKSSLQFFYQTPQL